MTKQEKKAIFDTLAEIVGTLAYQAEIPHQHKLDMFNKLDEARKALGLPEPEGQPT